VDAGTLAVRNVHPSAKKRAIHKAKNSEVLLVCERLLKVVEGYFFSVSVCDTLDGGERGTCTFALGLMGVYASGRASFLFTRISSSDFGEKKTKVPLIVVPEGAMFHIRTSGFNFSAQ
jgi:hypothetical protein